MKIEPNPRAWNGDPPSLLGWWRVADRDGSTVAYVPDEVTARIVAAALRFRWGGPDAVVIETLEDLMKAERDAGWDPPPCGWTCRVHQHGTESAAPCAGG